MPNRVKPPPPIHCHHYNPGVTVTELAEGSVAEHVGYLIGLIGIPLVGAILLIAGLRQRSRRRRLPPPANPMVPPGYPPPGPYPYGYPPPPPPGIPPNTGYPEQPGLLSRRRTHRITRPAIRRRVRVDRRAQR